MRWTQDTFLVGTTGIIFNDKNEVLLLKHTYRQHAWSLPGGYMKAKEHPLEGMEREIEEETGFVVSVDEPFKIRTDRETARLDIACIGKYVGGEFRESDEVVEAGFFTVDNMPLIAKNQLLMIEQALKYKATPHETNTITNEQLNKADDSKWQKVRRWLPFGTTHQ
jgi:ADP-ribose pyrophosphatase YjhB (NUDIX family)